jgi:V/A-type H+-transporting ATPase subunit E
VIFNTGVFMAEEIRDLIEKINQEGIRAAEEKARNIEAAANQRADEILSRARQEAEEMVAAARDRIRREDETGKILLAEAGRDLLLSLRKEINAMLGRIVVTEVRDALTPEALSRIIAEAVRHYSAGEDSDITVVLKKEDLSIIEKHFMNRLGGEIKKTILLKPSDEIPGGFTISFDNGRSCHDFSDRALADYIGTYLKPKLNSILQESLKE